MVVSFIYLPLVGAIAFFVAVGILIANVESNHTEETPDTPVKPKPRNLKLQSLLTRPTTTTPVKETTQPRSSKTFRVKQTARELNELSPDHVAEYMESEEWKLLRSKVITRDNFVCQICSSPYSLVVHHITYIRFTKELLPDLTTLCRSCHQDLHNNLGTSRLISYPINRSQYYE